MPKIISHRYYLFSKYSVTVFIRNLLICLLAVFSQYIVSSGKDSLVFLWELSTGNVCHVSLSAEFLFIIFIVIWWSLSVLDDKQPSKQTDWQTDRQTGRQTKTDSKQTHTN